ncbi:MAG: isoprenoid biosynthesis glyoxalase ElbB [Alphaproteobacteria bacterium]|nr:isoprenoid biosynthesis glyoxalase ElbB [Alphaproteobacteria bacterium]
MSKQKHFAVVFSGCGRADGSEIYESVSALYAVAKSGSTYQCFAPDINQSQVIDLYNRSQMKEKRNVLIESARLARGNIKDLKHFKAEDFDGIIFPGGMGAVSNWCDYAQKGLNCTINSEIKRAVLESHRQKKVIGAMCIAPTLIALLLAPEKVIFTLGAESPNTRELETLGAVHKETSATGVCVDTKNLVCSTPAYMLATDITEVFTGAENMVAKMLELMN